MFNTITIKSNFQFTSAKNTEPFSITDNLDFINVKKYFAGIFLCNSEIFFAKTLILLKYQVLCTIVFGVGKLVKRISD